MASTPSPFLHPDAMMVNEAVALQGEKENQPLFSTVSQKFGGVDGAVKLAVEPEIEAVNGQQIYGPGASSEGAHC